MDAKGAAIVAKKYFEDTKSIIKFIFETISVKKDSENWIIICIVQDLFDDEAKKFKIIVNNDGEVLDVEKMIQVQAKVIIDSDHQSRTACHESGQTDS